MFRNAFALMAFAAALNLSLASSASAQQIPAVAGDTSMPTDKSAFNGAMSHTDLQNLSDYIDRSHQLTGGDPVKALAEAKAETTKLATRLSLSCDVTDAEKVGHGRSTVNGTTSETNVFEVACANGMGYFIVSQADQAPTAMSCFSAEATHAADVAQGVKSDMYCQLKANKDTKVMAATILANAGAACGVRNLQWFGQSSATHTEYSEVACDNGKGFLVRTALPGAPQPTVVMSCQEAAQQGLKCKLTDGGPVSMPVTMDTLKEALAKNGVKCTADQIRLIGQENSRKRYVIEAHCPEQPKGLIAFIPLEGNANPFESMNCSDGYAHHVLCEFTTK
jgi:hypothetical protein